MKFYSGLPMTDRERAACDKRKRERLAQGLLKRKATPSGQNYSRKPSAADKRLTQRILGETDDSR